MEKIYRCPVCGSTEIKQNGAELVCRFCKNAFSENGINGNASSASQNGETIALTGNQSPVIGYANTLVGNPTPPPPPANGFSAPPQSLIDSLQRNAAANRQAVTNESNSENSGSSRRRGNSGSGNSARNEGSGSGSSRAGGSNSSGSASSNGSSSSNNSSSGGNGGLGNNNASDSENNVRFLDNVSLMNDLAYELVNGNANAWANIARNKGIINSKQHTEIKYIVATRNCIAHGSGDSVRITAELVQSARNYYELMRRTASQIK